MSRPEREQLERDIKLAAAEPIEIRALGRNVRVAPIFVYLVGAIIIGVAAGQVIGGGLAMIAVIFGVCFCLVRGGSPGAKLKWSTAAVSRHRRNACHAAA